METSNIIMNSTFSIEFTGPTTPYTSIVNYNFIDSKTLKLEINITSFMSGEKKDLYKIKFDTQKFKSKGGANLVTEKLEGWLYKVPVIPEAIALIGSTANSAISSIAVLMIASNILLSQSSELLWGFMNTLQIIYYLPLLQLYYPDALAQLLTYFSASKAGIPITIPKIDEYKSQLEERIKMQDKLNMSAENERYEELEYESSGFLSNGSSLIIMLIQGFCSWVIIFGIRGFFITLGGNIDIYENKLKEEEKLMHREHNKGNVKINYLRNFEQEKEEVENKLKHKWIKKKLQEISSEYKYNFFLRVGLQAYLEV